VVPTLGSLETIGRGNAGMESKICETVF